VEITAGYEFLGLYNQHSQFYMGPILHVYGVMVVS